MSSIIIQTPSEPSQQLFLLFHGYGADPTDLEPVGQTLAQAFPQATVVCVAAPQGCEVGFGLQWYSLQGLMDRHTPNEDVALHTQRVQAVLPSFIDTVKQWQARSKVSANATALLGFSQGAIMALEASKSAELLAGRIVALSGRYVTMPTKKVDLLTLHLVHGKLDDVIPYRHTVDAAHALQTIGNDFTADVIPHLGHGIDQGVLDLILNRLQSHVPKRLWDEALQAAKTL